MPEILIDGESVEFTPGETILQVAWRAGKPIPVLCYHPHLPVYAGCRVCLVELEEKGRRRVVPSCATEAREGMVVYTDTERVKRYVRRSVLSFLLANHPLECPVCDRGGECDLQNLVFLWGPERATYSFDKFEKPKKKALPFLELYPNRCVLCNRCVNFYRIIAGDEDWGLYYRSNRAYVGPLKDGYLSGEFSGNMSEICPLGAITDRFYRFRARPWELKRIKTFSFHDSYGANLYVYVRGESPEGRGPIVRGGERGELHEIIKVQSRPNLDLNNPWIDDRSKFCHDFVNSQLRQTKYILRKNGEERELNPEEAYRVFFDAVTDIASKYGGDSLAFLSGGRGTNESAYLFAQLFRKYLGSKNLDTRSPLAGSPDVLIKYWGVSASLSKISELENFDPIVVVHPSIRGSAPSLAIHLRKAKRSGKEVYYFGYSDDGGERRWATQIILGRPAELGEEFEKLCISIKSGESLPVFIFSDHIPIQLKELILRNSVELEGAGFIVVREGPNVQGFIDMGIHPELLPGQVLSPTPGLSSGKVVEAILEGRIKGLVLWNVDPLAEFPRRTLWEEALKKLELLVVIDSFKTEASLRADLVIPAPVPHEEEGSCTNMEGRVQFKERALGDYEGIMPLTKFLAGVLNLFGDSEFSGEPREIFDLIRRDLEPYTQISYGNLEELIRDYPDFMPSLGGLKYAYRYRTARYRFSPKASEAETNFGDRGELLLVGLPHLYGDRYSYASGIVKELIPSNAVEISPDDAREAGVEDGERVLLSDGENKVEVELKVVEGIRKGILRTWGPLYRGGINKLLNESGYAFVKLEKMS